MEDSTTENFEWYLLAPGQSQTEGPFSLREIDVKFRTNECTSMWHVWKDGMKEWKRAYEVDEIKKVIMESRGEVLDEVVQEYVKNLANNKSEGEGGKKEKRKRQEDED